MQTVFKALFAVAIFAVGTGAALAADPAIGTWKLNLEKSKFSPGPGPQSQTRTYTESADGTQLTVKTTANGKESTYTLTFKADGKPYPGVGNPDFDMVAVTQMGASTVHSVQTKAGVKVGTGVRTISKDGKTLTFKQKGTHADGGKYDNVSVYDRQ
jgi:hypothetical protein